MTCRAGLNHPGDAGVCRIMDVNNSRFMNGNLKCIEYLKKWLFVKGFLNERSSLMDTF